MFFSAILIAANAALLDLADVAGAGDDDREQLTRWPDRGRAGLASRFDTQAGRKQLGSPQQSWTAAVTLDWSASDQGA